MSRKAKLCEKLDREAEAAGYHLNPDREFTRELVGGLVTNEDRYGYPACPCRLASGVKDDDLDIICPCDYRDADLTQWGACYCALYVSQEIKDGRKEARPVPERRASNIDERRKANAERTAAAEGGGPAYPVWRCGVCGYLCARDEPPAVCPICKAKKERFRRFM